MLAATQGAPHLRCIAGQTMTGARGQQDVGQQVGRESGGIRPDQASRRRSDQNEIGGLAEPGVRDRAVPQACLHRLAGQRERCGDAQEVFRALVITGMTWAPASTNRRQISTAL
jgi:hypothetical protein